MKSSSTCRISSVKKTCNPIKSTKTYLMKYTSIAAAASTAQPSGQSISLSTNLAKTASEKYWQSNERRTTVKLMLNLVVFLVLVMISGEAFSSDVMGNGLQDTQVSNDCIGNCTDDDQFSVELTLKGLLDIARVLTKHKDYYDNGYSSVETRASKWAFVDYKKGISCVKSEQDGDSWSNKRHPDAYFYVNGINKSVNDLEKLDFDSSQITEGTFSNSDLISYKSMAQVNSDGDVIEFVFLQDKTTKNIRAINYRLSRCFDRSPYSLKFGQGPNNFISHWLDYDSKTNITVASHDGQNYTSSRFTGKTALIATIQDKIQSIELMINQYPVNSIWEMQVSISIAALERSFENYDQFKARAYDLILLMLVKYKEEGMSKAAVINRVQKVFGSTVAIRGLRKIINEAF